MITLPSARVSFRGLPAPATLKGDSGRGSHRAVRTFRGLPAPATLEGDRFLDFRRFET